MDPSHWDRCSFRARILTAGWGTLGQPLPSSSSSPRSPLLWGGADDFHSPRSIQQKRGAEGHRFCTKAFQGKRQLLVGMGRGNRQDSAALNSRSTPELPLAAPRSGATALQPGRSLTVVSAPLPHVLQRLTATDTAPPMLRGIFVSQETGHPGEDFQGEASFPPTLQKGYFFVQ